ncbi:MAG: helix-turn-helix domain-containing protein [Campylobacterota bacterium]|nr:helix-turn-helix domain-containing protein [Campylobacterota bacterium]
MKKINIDDAEIIDKLKELKNFGTSKQERIRSHAVLLLSDGVKLSEIAKIFDVSDRMVYNWISEWNNLGLTSLKRKKGDGRKPLLNDKEDKELIQRLIEENPHQPKKAYALALEELKKSISYKTFQRFLKKHLISATNG